MRQLQRLLPHSFQSSFFQRPAVFPARLEVFWKEGSLERMDMEGTRSTARQTFQIFPVAPKDASSCFRVTSSSRDSEFCASQSSFSACRALHSDLLAKNNKFRKWVSHFSWGPHGVPFRFPLKLQTWAPSNTHAHTLLPPPPPNKFRQCAPDLSTCQGLAGEGGSLGEASQRPTSMLAPCISLQAAPQSAFSN